MEEDYGKWMRDNISQGMEYFQYTQNIIDEMLENSSKYWAGEFNNEPEPPKPPTLKEIRLKKLKNIEKNSKK